jgi:hypothetical protein
MPYLSITKIPLPSGPRVFSTGTLTLSNVIKAVPAVGDYRNMRKKKILENQNYIASLDRLCLQAFAAFNENHCKTILNTTSIQISSNIIANTHRCLAANRETGVIFKFGSKISNS